MTSQTPKHPHLRLVPRQHPAPCRYPGMDCQQAWEAKREVQDAWLKAHGFDPATVVTGDLIRLVHRRAERPRDGWAQVFGPGWQPPDPNARYAIIERAAAPPVPADERRHGNGEEEGAGLFWQPPDPDARYDINTDE